MFRHKSIIIVTVLVLISTLSFIVVSGLINSNSQSKFTQDGYILTNGDENSTKQYIFSNGTSFKNCVSNKIEFEDIQGNQIIIPAETFVHYDDGSMSSLQSGVILNINELGGNFVNNYSLPKNMILTKQGESYTVENANNQVMFDDFIYKLSENRFILVSKELSVKFSSSDTRNVQDYVEISYIDNGIIQLATKENVWRTVSNDCVITLANGSEFNTSEKMVTSNKTTIGLNQLVVDAEDNIQLNNKQTAKVPIFNITAVDGKNGTSGDSGASGEIGEDGIEGNNGLNGDAGDNGNSGSAGENGDAGAAGNVGTSGGAGASGSTGSTGSTSGSSGSGDSSSGSSGSYDPTKNQVPVFNITSFEVNAYSVNAKIQIENDTNLYNDLLNIGSVKIYEVSTGKTFDVESEPGNTEFDFTSGATEFTISYSWLKPDMEYRLIINAPYKIGEKIYKRDFVNRTFYTDSLGVFMEKETASTNSINIKVTKKLYSLSKSATVYLLTADQANSTFDINNTISYKYFDCAFDSSKIGHPEEFTASFTSLTANTEYVARIVVNNEGAEVTDPDIITLSTAQLKVKTLKEKPSLGNPLVNPNRLSGCFEMQLSSLTDVHNGVREFKYQIFECSETGTITNANPVKAISSNSTNPVNAYIDGHTIKKDTIYTVKVFAVFYDNEKYIEYSTGYSTPFTLAGSSIPSVYIKKDSTTFNSIDGSIVIVNTDATIDYTKGITIEVESPAVYYKKVVLNNLDSTSTQTTIPFSAIFASENLKCDSTYRFTVWGYIDLNDGSGSTYRMIGVATEKTLVPKTLMATWSDVSGGTNAIAKTFQLSGVDSAYEANSLSQITFSLYKGSDTTAAPIGTFTDVDKDNDLHESTLKATYYDTSTVITEIEFGLSANLLTNPNYTLVVSGTFDETKGADQSSLEYKTTFANEIPVSNTTTTVFKTLSPPDFPSNTDNSLKITEIQNGIASEYGGTKKAELTDDATVGFKIQADYDNFAKLAKKVNYYVFDKQQYEYYYANQNLYADKKDPIEAGLYLYNVSLDVSSNDTFLPPVNILFDGHVSNFGTASNGVKYYYAGSYNANGTSSTGMSRGLDYYFAYTVDYVTAVDQPVASKIYPYDFIKYTKGLVLRSKNCETFKIAPVFAWYPVSLDDTTYTWKYNCTDVDNALYDKNLVVKKSNGDTISVSGGDIQVDPDWHSISLTGWADGNFTASINQNLKLYSTTNVLTPISTQPVQQRQTAPTSLKFTMDTSNISTNKLSFNISGNNLNKISAIKATFSASGVTTKSVFLSLNNDGSSITGSLKTTELENFVLKNTTITLDAYYDTGYRGFGMGTSSSDIYALQAITSPTVALGNYKTLVSGTLVNSTDIMDSAFTLSDLNTTAPTSFTLTSVLSGQQNVKLTNIINNTGVVYTSTSRETILLKKLASTPISYNTNENVINLGGITPSISITSNQSNIDNVKINYSLSGTNSITDGNIKFKLYKKDTSGNFNHVEDFTVPTSQNTYTFTGLDIGTSYKILVYANISTGETQLINGSSFDSDLIEYYFTTLSRVTINISKLQYTSNSYFDKKIDLFYSLDQVLGFNIQYSFYSIKSDNTCGDQVLSHQQLITSHMMVTNPTVYSPTDNKATFQCFPGTDLKPGTKYRLYVKAISKTSTDQLGETYQDITIPFPRQPEFFIKTKSEYNSTTDKYSIKYYVTATDPEKIITGDCATSGDYTSGSYGQYKIKIFDSDGNDVTSSVKDYGGNEPSIYSINTPNQYFILDNLPNDAYSKAYTIKFYAILDNNNDGKESINTITYENLNDSNLVNSKVAFTTNKYGITVGDVCIKENTDTSNGTLNLGFTNFTSLDKITKVQYTILSQKDGTVYNGTIVPTGSATTLFKPDAVDLTIQKLILPPKLTRNMSYSVTAHFLVGNEIISTFSDVYILE